MEKLGFGICPKVQASNHCHFHGSEGQKTIHWWKACRVAMTPGNPFSSEVWASLAGSCSIRYNSYAQAQRPVPPGTVKRISVFTRTFYVFPCLLNDHCRTWCHGLMTFFSLHSSWPLLDWARPYLWTTLETDCPSPGKLRTASSCPRVETNHWALDEPGDRVWEPCSMGINTARVTLSRATCLHWEHGRKPSCEV